MAYQDGDGKWVASDGSLHDKEHFATAHEGNTAQGSGATGAGTAAGAGGVGGIIGGIIGFLLLPGLIVKIIVGILWGLLQALGIFGKIVQSLLMAVIAPLLVFIPLSMVGEELRVLGIDSRHNGLLGIALAALAIITPFWYFFWHYDVVKAMEIDRFSNKLFWFTGFIWISWCVGYFGIGFFGMFGGDPITGAWVSFAGIPAAFLFYFLSTLKYRKYVTRGGSFKYRWIVFAPVVCLTVSLILWAPGYLEEKAARKADNRAANKAANEAGVVTAKAANNKKQEAIAAKYVSGTVVFVSVNSTINMFEEANTSSKVIKEFRNKGGEKLIANGEVLFDPDIDWLFFVSVDYNGTKGWIGGGVSPAIGIATVVADKVEFNPKYTYDAKGVPIKHPNIALKKGDTFEVLYVSKKDKSTDGVYKGTLGSVRSSDVEVTINK